MLGKKAIVVWVAVVAAIGTGSLAIAVQPVSDEKIHLQDVDGKIHTNVPVAASRAFSPLPVEFDEDNTTAPFNTAKSGSTIITKQKVVINFVIDVSESADEASFFLDNRSEDRQIFLIKAGAPSNVLLDFETHDVTIHGLTGHNEWLASIAANANGAEVVMEISTTDAGFYPIVVELLRVG